jgi:hypothetical protein
MGGLVRCVIVAIFGIIGPSDEEVLDKKKKITLGRVVNGRRRHAERQGRSIPRGYIDNAM